MSKLLQLRGGTTSEHSTFTGALREVTVDTTKDTLVVHDGSTAGGFAMPSSADKTKLDTIEASATADQTDAEIRTAVEAATDSNVFTDADHTKLNAIEASATADQSDAEIKTAVEAATSIALAGSPTTTTQAALDNSTKIATTAYADSAVAVAIDAAPAALDTLNELAAALGDDANYATTTANAIGTKMPLAGGAFTGAVTTNSTFDGVDIATRDGVLTSTTTTADAALPKTGGAMTGAITTNSTFDGVDIATRDAILSSTTTTAAAALPKAGGAMTGAITTNSTFDGRDVATDGTKLDTITIGTTVQAYDADTTKNDVANTFTGQQTFTETKDTVYNITDGAGFEIDPVNGNVQTVTLGAARTAAATNFAAGQSILIGVDDGSAYALTWPTMTWIVSGGGAAAPDLATTGYTWIVLWKQGSTLFGSSAGSV